MFIWILFLIGQLIHIMAQIESVVRSKATPVTLTRTEVLNDRLPAFLIRGFITTCLFWIFLGGGLPDLLIAFKVETPGWLLALSAVINSQAGPPLAGIIGFSIDSMLAYVPFLKSYVPEDK